MENNKYYTPSTEELRVGLEYETLREMKGGTMVPKEEHIERWSKETMDKWNLANILTSWPHIIRIKYLDTQDIKELGFTHEGVGVFMNDSGNMIAIHPDGNVIILHSPEGHCLFDGKILNKSELKWILARIGVL